MDCHFLLQGIFPTQGSHSVLHCRQILYHRSHQGGPIRSMGRFYIPLQVWGRVLDSTCDVHIVHLAQYTRVIVIFVLQGPSELPGAWWACRFLRSWEHRIRSLRSRNWSLDVQKVAWVSLRDCKFESHCSKEKKGDKMFLHKGSQGILWYKIKLESKKYCERQHSTPFCDIEDR